MTSISKIEWTEMTWNPVTGCTKISEGCKNCYAERMAKRLHAMGNLRYKNSFNVTLHQDLIKTPLQWKNPKTIFVNSMSDLFHEQVPLEFIRLIFETMLMCPQHTFQILTKRSQRLKELANFLPWPKNIWIGVSVENADNVNRIIDLNSVPAFIRFVSCEPLVGSIPHLPTEGVNWIIVGGESGPFARPMQAEWVDEIFTQCKLDHVAFFFKQWGGPKKKLKGRTYQGKIFDEMPELAFSS